jgi:hypothetical protein
MPHRANDNLVVRLPPPPEEPDAHGQATLILAGTLHALVDMKTMTTQQALDIVSSAEEIKTEVPALSGESETRMQESLELLKRIGISIERDAG